MGCEAATRAHTVPFGLPNRTVLARDSSPSLRGAWCVEWFVEARESCLVHREPGMPEHIRVLCGLRRCESPVCIVSASADKGAKAFDIAEGSTLGVESGSNLGVELKSMRDALVDSHDLSGHGRCGKTL